MAAKKKKAAKKKAAKSAKKAAAPKKAAKKAAAKPEPSGPPKQPGKSKIDKMAGRTSKELQKAIDKAALKNTGKPAPKPRPKPQKTSSERIIPPGCTWTRLRAGIGTLTTRAAMADGSHLKVRLFEGLRYAMPPGTEFGNAGKPHPAIVVESAQPDFPAINIEAINVERTLEQRSAVADFLGRAEVALIKYNGKEEWVRLRKKGIAAVVTRFNALAHELGYLEVEGFKLDPDLPPGVFPITDTGDVDGVPLDAEEVKRMDELACHACGKAHDNKRDLARHKAQGHKPTPVPEWLQKVLTDQLNAVTA